LANGPGGAEFLGIGGSGVCGFFHSFNWFPDGVIISSESSDVGCKGCFSHFMESGLEFVAGLVEKASIFWCVGFLPSGSCFMLDDH